MEDDKRIPSLGTTEPKEDRRLRREKQRGLTVGTPPDYWTEAVHKARGCVRSGDPGARPVWEREARGEGVGREESRHSTPAAALSPQTRWCASSRGTCTYTRQGRTREGSLSTRDSRLPKRSTSSGKASCDSNDPRGSCLAECAGRRESS